MPETIGEAFVAVRPEPGTEQQFASGLRSRMAGPLRGVGRAVGLGLAGGLLGAVAGLGAVVHTGIGEVLDASKVQAQTAAVIKSTGGAAKVTAEQVSDLAAAIQEETSVADDAVQAGANLLLTFKEIRNEAGRGNDIFNQATEILTDMSVALGTDVPASAVQLGKALNDPIKGVAALGRVGVTFTDQQKEMIRSLVETGRTADAQKIILAELRSEFGGSAKAYGESLPGQLAKARRAFENMAEGAVSALAPLAGPVLEAVGAGMRALAPAIETVVNAIGTAANFALLGFTDGLDALDAASGGAESTLVRLGAAVRQYVAPAVQAAAEYVRESLLPALRDVAGFVAANVLPVLAGLGEFFFTQVIPAVQSLQRVLVTGLRAALDSVGRKIAENRPQLEQLFRGLRAVAGFIVDVLAPVLRTTLGLALRNAGIVIGQVIDLVSTAVDVFNTLRGAAASAGGFIKDVFETVRTVVAGIVNFIIDAINKAIDAVNAIPDISLPGIGRIGVPEIERLRRISAGGGTPTAPAESDVLRRERDAARSVGAAVAEALRGTVVVLDDRAVGAIDTRQGRRAARR